MARMNRAMTSWGEAEGRVQRRGKRRCAWVPGTPAYAGAGKPRDDTSSFGYAMDPGFRRGDTDFYCLQWFKEKAERP